MQSEKFEIENKIEEIQGMLDDCESKRFDSSKLIVPSDTIYDLLAELKNCIPEEIDRYRKIIDQRNKIINGANADAKRILEEANRQKERLISEEAVVEDAKQQAQYIIEDAKREAEAILADARRSANANVSEASRQAHEVFDGAVGYTADRLDDLERVLDDLGVLISDGMRSFESHINENLSLVRQNRSELDHMTFEDVPAEEYYDDDMGEEGDEYLDD